jgi:hypothetical protein
MVFLMWLQEKQKLRLSLKAEIHLSHTCTIPIKNFNNGRNVTTKKDNQVTQISPEKHNNTKTPQKTLPHTPYILKLSKKAY